MFKWLRRCFKDGHEAVPRLPRTIDDEATLNGSSTGHFLPKSMNSLDKNSSSTASSNPIEEAYSRLTANSTFNRAQHPDVDDFQNEHERRPTPRRRRRPRNPYNLTPPPAYNQLSGPSTDASQTSGKHTTLNGMAPRLFNRRGSRHDDHAAVVEEGNTRRPTFSQWLAHWTQEDEEVPVPTSADFSDPRDWEIYCLQKRVAEADRRIDFLQHTIGTMERGISTLTKERELAMKETTSLLDTLRRVRRRLIAADPTAPLANDPSEAPATYVWNKWYPQAVAYPADLDAFNSQLEARRRQREDMRRLQTAHNHPSGPHVARPRLHRKAATIGTHHHQRVHPM